jgi:NitT/TauT family transport system permease protein
MRADDRRSTPTSKDKQERGGVALSGRRLLAIACWLVVWQLASVAVGSQLLLAGPLETLATLARLLPTPEFWAAVGFSFVRVALGFLVAFCLSLALAAAAQRSSFVAELVAVGLGAIKSVPVVCIVVLLLMLVGSRNVSAVAVFLVTLPALYFSAREALANLDPGMRELLDACGVYGRRRLFGHVWPSMHPFLVATCKNVVGMGWKAGVAAELIGMPLGSMGERIYQTKLLLESGELFAWTIVVVLLAAASERVFLAALEASVRLSLRIATTCAAVDDVDEMLTPPGCAALDAVTVRFGEQLVIDELDLRLGAGERLCLDEPSGRGKTTLMRLLAGVLAPTGGVVTLVPSEPQRASFMPQESCLIEDVSVVRNVALLAGDHRSEQSIRALLRELLDESLLDRRVSELSGGQRRRVELVRAVARPSGMLLLDEPFASLDEANGRAAADFIKRHLDGRTLVVASHLAETATLLDASTYRLG